jgi:hypothetical protein
MDQNIGSARQNAGPIPDGIAFEVRVEGEKHECLVLHEALFKLAELGDENADPADTFRAFERTICGVARRLVHAGVPGNPVILRANHFRLASL